VTLLSAKLLRAHREFESAEGARLVQEDELQALRQQVLMLRSQLTRSEEERTVAYAKLNGVFHGEESQWMTRELLLHDEVQDLEEVLSRAIHDKAVLGRTEELNRELQAEIEELLAIETSLQNKLDETSSQLKHAQQENSQKDVQIERAKATEVKLIDREGKAKLRMQAAEAALAEAEASYSKGAMRWRVQIDVLKTAVEEVETELYRAVFTLAKHGITVPPPVRTFKHVVNTMRSFDIAAASAGSGGAGAAAANLAQKMAQRRRASACATTEHLASAAAATALHALANSPSAASGGDGGSLSSVPRRAACNWDEAHAPAPMASVAGSRRVSREDMGQRSTPPPPKAGVTGRRRSIGTIAMRGSSSMAALSKIPQ